MGCKFISDKKDFVKSIDVGIIATPSQYHLHDIVLLINNNKDCFVEKPLSHEIIETKKILDYAKKKKIIVFVGQNLRFHPAVKKAKQWIDNKIIGKVLWSRLICSSYLPDWRKNYDFKKNYANNKKAGGVIFDCIHEIDLANYLMGKTSFVNSVIRKSGLLDLDVEDFADINLRHKGGHISSIHLDYLTKPKFRITQVAGEKGVIEIDISNRKIKLINNTGKIIKKNSYSKDFNIDYKNEIKSFLDNVKKRSRPICDGHEGLEVLRQAIQAKNDAA